MKPTNEVELTFAQKAKIVGTMSLVTVALMASAVGYTSYQRNAKTEAAELAKTQAANIAKLMTVFPVYRETKEFKEIEEKTMVKVNFSDLPTTVSATFASSNCESIPPGAWFITKGVTNIADYGTPNGWSVGAGGSISIPTLTSSDYGTYDIRQDTGVDCGGRHDNSEPITNSKSSRRARRAAY